MLDYVDLVCKSEELLTPDRHARVILGWHVRLEVCMAKQTAGGSLSTW